ncbi:MAG: tyrosine-type recombinase/integrase, partial [Pseudomonadota bacterium]
LRRIKKLKLRSLDLSFLPDVKLAEGRSRTRPPFTTAWLRDKILAPGALGGLNDQARDCVLIMINSGMRPSEIVGLRPEHFALDQPIPLVQVKPDGKQLKNNHSERSVPMAGVSLDAARRRAAQGFPRYFAKDAISAVVNKYMRENGLMESVDHTLYSIRHAFEDRLIVAGVDERVRSDLFGHSIQRERYGAGGGDDVRFAAIRSIAL